jgi:7-carboxy-7-deazaguanine synthase
MIEEDPELRKRLKELDPEPLPTIDKPKIKKPKKIPIVEIFGPTIQGEGSVIGYQTTFVRFGGCDYRCEKCDSLHAVLPELVKANATYMTTPELIKAVEAKQGHTEWITLSGGNPCMWDLTDFVEHFYGKYDAQKGMVVKEKLIAVETQGTVWRDWLYNCDVVTVSPKGPGMGEKFEPDKFEVFVRNLNSHAGFAVKIPCFEQRDLELAVEIMQTWPQTKNRMFLSVGNYNPPEVDADTGKIISQQDLTSACLTSYRLLLDDVLSDPRLSSVRILPQMHVLLWGNQLGR